MTNSDERGSASCPSYPSLEYQVEHEVLAEICEQYLSARESGDFTELQLLTGMLVGQTAVIYNLSMPAGILRPSTLFKDEMVPDYLSEHDKDHIAAILAGYGDWFSAHLLRLCAKADPINLTKLRSVFPEHVHALEEWWTKRGDE